MGRGSGRAATWAGVALVLLGILACRGRDEALERIGKALARCDDAAACAAAAAELRGLDRPRRDSPAGIEARLAALRVTVAALAAWPEADREFLQGAGLEPERALSLLEEEARAVEALGAPGAGAADARALLAAWREPACARFQALEAVEGGGGRFADVAWLVRASQLAQLVGAVEAQRVQAHAEFARMLLGCRLPRDASDTEVLLEARGLLDRVSSSCPKAAGAAPRVRSSCERLGEAVSTWSLPLPFESLTGGDLAGAMLPLGRGYGFSFTPPWVLVLSSGRLVLAEQPVLPPGAQAVPAAEPRVLLDLRRSHRPLDVRYAVKQALEGREPPVVRTRKFLPLAVDRAETWSDLAEVLEAAQAETDLQPALATLPSGARVPAFLPVNWQVTSHPLSDPWGGRVDFRADPPPVDLDLNPFALAVRTAGFDRSVDVLPVADEAGNRRPALRAAYGAATEAVGPAGSRSARLTASSTTSVGLVVAVMEALAARLPPQALASDGLFATASPARQRGGQPDPLLVPLVLRAAGAAAP